MQLQPFFMLCFNFKLAFQVFPGKPSRSSLERLNFSRLQVAEVSQCENQKLSVSIKRQDKLIRDKEGVSNQFEMRKKGLWSKAYMAMCYAPRHGMLISALLTLPMWLFPNVMWIVMKTTSANATEELSGPNSRTLFTDWVGDPTWILLSKSFTRSI